MRITSHFSQLWEKGTPTARHLNTYFFFALLRLVLVFVPQLGYVHPDEFFQSVEVMTGEYYSLHMYSANYLNNCCAH